MEKKKLTRKEFMVNTSKYAIGAAVGVAGINAIMSGNELRAGSNNSNSANWPYPYAALDAEETRLVAYSLYWNGKDCSSGVFGALVQKLEIAVGDPWTGFPIEVLLFGRGGGVGWGSLCGALNGGAALISLAVDKGPSADLINELWGWYTTENLPTDLANSISYPDPHFVGEMPQNIAGSPLCHPSVSQWCLIAGKKVHDVERKERCARIAGDVAAKTVEILNEYYAGTFVPTFTDPASNATCMGCHGGEGDDNVMTHMECLTCHTPHTGIESLGGVVTGYALHNAYPNPFSQSTNIKFSIPETGIVRLEVYNLKGQLVKSLIDSETMKPGTYKADWNGTNNSGQRVAVGTYFVRMTTGNFMKTIKLNLL